MYFELEEGRPAEAEDLARFMRLYDYRRAKSGPLPTAVWDERADEWEAEFRSGQGTTAKSLERVAATVDYLRERGILAPNSDIVDVGFGPGRFVAGFARECHSAMGIDISPRMVSYAEQYAKELGLANTRFAACDFHGLDVEQAGLAGRFDLVFCSITPAANGVGGVEKLMRMSRGWCFSSNFVAAENHLETRMAKELFGKKAAPRWDAHWVYGLFNMLFVAGYFPEVRYYSRHKEEQSPANRESARQYLQCLPRGDRTPVNEDRVLRWLEGQAGADGTVGEASDFTYAWILWEVNRRGDRPIYPADYR